MPLARILGWVTVVTLAPLLGFIIQPIAAKALLPALGGTAGVWVSVLLFFQLTYLAGYLYAFVIARYGRRGLFVHIGRACQDFRVWGIA